jgi:outer membrane protein OmpA-like peptidoglycan-associated protein
MAEEQQRLQSLFNGTPVVIALTDNGHMRVEIPLRFCFDPGRAAVKPAFAKLLDHMAGGLRLQRTTEVRIAAPADPDAGALLAADRAAAARDYLVARAVAAGRISSAAAAPGAPVELMVSAPQP